MNTRNFGLKTLEKWSLGASVLKWEINIKIELREALLQWTATVYNPVSAFFDNK
jgi:hypothetical protein